MELCSECHRVARVVERTREKREDGTVVERVVWECWTCDASGVAEHEQRFASFEPAPDRVGRGVSRRESHPLE